jgi:hypothetical protein
MNRLLGPIILLALAFVLAGCAASGTDDRARAVPTQEAELDIPAVEGLPDYAYRSATALQGYQIAVLEKDLLAKLPCYCGCGQDEQFQNLRDCFLDGHGKFNSHGANCGVCQEEAVDAVTWKKQGMTVKAIRDRIDKEYEGRGKPTDTPPVTE